MDFFDVVTPQRAMRRLKTDAIPDAVLQKIMDAAICAPSGGNRQNWSFVVVRDRAKRARLGELYRGGGVGRADEGAVLRRRVEGAGGQPSGQDARLSAPPRGASRRGAGDHSRVRHA